MAHSPQSSRPGSPRTSLQWLRPLSFAALLGLLTSCSQEAPVQFADAGPGLGYAHETVAKVPWSIHVVRVDRTDPTLSLHAVHAGGGALGLEPLSAQVRRLPATAGKPVAALNGDFYQRERAYAGDPRGLQIAEGELLSAPSGGLCLGWDLRGQPHILELAPQFTAQWPDGSAAPFGLNEETKNDTMVLYTPAAGASTHTAGTRELVLVPVGASAAPLQLNSLLTVRVREVRDGGGARLERGTLVLSIGPALVHRMPKTAAGTELKLDLFAAPKPLELRNAIGGGPQLVSGGKSLKIHPKASDSYSVTSMTERHPRSAIGWNRTHYFLVEVDGRQKDLSVGMTLEELGRFMARLGCDEAMNLDGGGSATLWMDGRVLNSPCDGGERPIANSLVVTRGAPTQP